MVREIPLTRGYVALVDDEDYARLSRYRWRVLSGRANGRYACRDGSPAFVDGKRQTILMHREIAAPARHLFVDHINRDGLDNRRSNLRVVTHYQNMLNTKRRPGRSGYRGVAQARSGRYVAQVWADGKRRYLGTFDTPEDAARAYDDAAIALHGVFAGTNFPHELDAAA